MRAFPLFALAVLAGCSETAQQRGQALFVAPGFSVSPSNVFACSTCHSVQKAGDPTLILPGYTLFDASSRPTFWGAAYPNFLDAVNECYVEFMRGTRLAPDDSDGRALLVYLESVSPDVPSPALPLTIVKNLGTICAGAGDTSCGATLTCAQDAVAMPPGWFCDIPQGDAGRGADLYQRSCQKCHGALHTGAGRIGPNNSIIPEESLQMHGTDPRVGARGITVEKIRHGKFFTVGGNMPFFSVEALSDAQIGDILSYMGL